jgi:hypothetical protein
VAEIFYNNIQWVQIYYRNQELRIQFFSPPNQDYWEFQLDLAMEAIEKAKRKLLEIG